MRTSTAWRSRERASSRSTILFDAIVSAFRFSGGLILPDVGDGGRLGITDGG
jgi:hypothetical protein